MKLYATITSERASKGQGGNDFIDGIFTVGEQEVLKVSIELEYGKVGNKYSLNVYDSKGYIVHSAALENTKGEKKKSEHVHKYFNESTGVRCEVGGEFVDGMKVADDEGRHYTKA